MAGEPITVVYPGRRNDERGADFRDAVILGGGAIRKGDIEVHVKSSYWRRHQHHRDEAYNSTVLHVALWQDETAPSRLQSGAYVPLVVLEKYLEPESEIPEPDIDSRYSRLPCRRAVRRLPPETVAMILDSAGGERFQEKARRLQSEIAVAGAGQCLYQNIMLALGYARNKRQFLELARRMPLYRLEFAGAGVDDDECLVRLQTNLLGTAGLLPSQCGTCLYDIADEEWIGRLEQAGQDLPLPLAMSYQDWCLFKIRPNNHPVRRLLAISHLLLRFRREGILRGVTERAEQAVKAGDGRGLEGWLTVTGEDCRKIGGVSGRHRWRRDAALLGKARAAAITVDIVLPFMLAWSKCLYRPSLGEQTLALYHCYRSLPGNAVTRHMIDQLGLAGRPVNTACRQQGLIHLYQNYCTQGGCEQCILGHGVIPGETETELTRESGAGCLFH